LAMGVVASRAGVPVSTTHRRHSLRRAVGDSFYNAIAESCFGAIKVELPYRRYLADTQEAAMFRDRGTCRRPAQPQRAVRMPVAGRALPQSPVDWVKYVLAEGNRATVPTPGVNQSPDVLDCDSGDLGRSTHLGLTCQPFAMSASNISCRGIMTKMSN
jgi:hypothetical protein